MTTLSTMGMHLIDGRNFSRDNGIRHRRGHYQPGLCHQDGAGSPTRLDKPSCTPSVPRYGIIGLVEDFNYESMRDKIEGVCIALGISPSIISVKMKTADVGSLIPQVTALWKKFSPDQPIRYTFLDERFKGMYADVQKQGAIFTTFAILAIIIACLGLFALSAFMAEQRTKEVSIRKVLGATSGQLMAMMSKDFVMLVMIAFLIAVPVAWWGMSNWLQNFVYRIDLDWWVFALAGVIVLKFIEIATISFQAVKPALSNPIKGLRAD